MFVLVILSLSLACNRFERSEVFETKLRQKRTEIQIEFDSIILRNNFVRYIDRLIEYENLGMDQRCEVEQVLFVTRVGILLPEMIDIFYPENESSTFDLENTPNNTLNYVQSRFYHKLGMNYCLIFR